MLPQQRYTKFEKAVVLQRLEANRTGHAERVRKARDIYQMRVVGELEKRLDQAARGEAVDPGFLQYFPIPQDYTKEYDRVIDRLQTSLGDEVELTDDEFNRWMRDEWDWTNRFIGSTATYLVEEQ